jgi:hypothetical protein
MDNLRLEELLNRHVDGTLDADQQREMEQMLLGSPEARAAFWRFTRLHSRIRASYQSQAGRRLAEDENGTSFVVPASAGCPAARKPAEAGTTNDAVPEPLPVIVVSDAGPSGGWQGPIAWFSQIGPLSYSVATVLVGVALLVASVVTVPKPTLTVRRDAPSPSPAERPALASVGRITGTMDCCWADPDVAPADAAVPLGGKFALASGLLEISYDSGAKVILQGPCTYEVDSAAGGFLALGKLTARVETKGEGGRGKAEGTDDQKSPFPLPPSAFVVHTPTAVVTDLGTEFGVEVTGDHRNRVYVFEGRVAVRSAAGKTSKPPDLVLSEGQSVALDANGAVLQSPASRQAKGKDSAAQFVRRMALPVRLGVLDLLDIVAGGDGTGHLREQGIDPTTGEKDATFPPVDRHGDRRYHPVPWNRLVDGVFVPDGSAGPVQLDSHGHTFRLPSTNGLIHGSIWARAADLAPDHLAMSPAYSVYAMGPGDEYMPDNRGLLAMHANAGITFDLEKIRKAHPDVLQPVLFRTFAGRAYPRGLVERGLVDIWVFVDGRLKFERRQLRQEDSPVHVDVELGPGDRFLTLVSSDGDRNTDNDWTVFGDPVLHVALKQESN